MRILFGPLKALFGGGAKTIIQRPAPVAAVPTPVDSRAEEDKARTEAERKTRSAALAREGRRATLLTDPGIDKTFAAIGKAGRRTLLGGPRQGG